MFIFVGFVFGTLGLYKPLMKHGPERFDTPIVLYYDNERKHFDGVQKGGNLFGKPYCYSCEKVYSCSREHTAKCRSHCMLCSRVGPTFPCQPFPGFHQKCQLCSKTFKNNDCYRHHMHSGFCKSSKYCEQCGVIWNVKNNTVDGRKGHICGER